MIKKVLLGALLVGTTATQAASLSGTYTADDFATVYLSTDLVADPGEVISDKPLALSATGRSNGWVTPASFADVLLEAGQDYYLLVKASNYVPGAPNPAMFVGEFALSGTGFTFLNGARTLLTDTTHWTVNETGFDAPGEAPISAGGNTGWFIPRSFAGISTEAQFIWPYEATFSTGYDGAAYFVTQIVAVPEPQSYAMFAAGIALLGGVARRRR